RRGRTVSRSGGSGPYGASRGGASLDSLSPDTRGAESETAMFRNILVPVDLTDRHGRALEIAAGLAPAGGAVTLLHIIELLHGVPREEESEFYERLEETAREHLDRLAATLR